MLLLFSVTPWKYLLIIPMWSTEEQIGQTLSLSLKLLTSGWKLRGGVRNFYYRLLDAKRKSSLFMWKYLGVATKNSHLQWLSLSWLIFFYNTYYIGIYTIYLFIKSPVTIECTYPEGRDFVFFPVPSGFWHVLVAG